MLNFSWVGYCTCARLISKMIDFGQGMNPNTCALILGTKFDDELLLMQVYIYECIPIFQLCLYVLENVLYKHSSSISSVIWSFIMFSKH